MKELNLNECLNVSGGDQFADAAAIGGVMSTATGIILGITFHQELGISLITGVACGATTGFVVGYALPFIAIGLYVAIQKSHELFTIQDSMHESAN